MTNYEEVRKVILDLYCETCPKDCEGLTLEERHGCLASGSFFDGLMEELKYPDGSPMIAILDPDQSLPDMTLNEWPKEVPE